MISKMAIADIAALRAEGIDVPPREVIRLNALGLKVERGTDSAELFAAPRVAFIGDAVLREPTLGAEMWLRQAMEAFDGDDSQTYFTLRVLSCVVPWRELPDPADERAVHKAIKATLARLGGATLRQLENALDWCVAGNLPESGEKLPEGATEQGTDEPQERHSPEFGLFHRGMACRIGTAADLKDMTVSAMLAVCERAEELAAAPLGGRKDRKAEKDKATGDYYRALDAVREAGKAAGDER